MFVRNIIEIEYTLDEEEKKKIKEFFKKEISIDIEIYDADDYLASSDFANKIVDDGNRYLADSYE